MTNEKMGKQEQNEKSIHPISVTEQQKLTKDKNN